MKRRKLIKTIEKMIKMLKQVQHDVAMYLTIRNKNVTLNLFQGPISKSIHNSKRKIWLNIS